MSESNDDARALDATDREDINPGAFSAEERASPGAAIQGYTIGLILAVLLTAASFAVTRAHFIWQPALPVALVVLAVAQIGIHLVFFLHITTAPDNTNNVLALAFGVLIVLLIIAGSLWIMSSLNHNMLPMHQARGALPAITDSMIV
jgi:cytochrome o ubiquinol oxidase operon protein cyoD